ncbi:MAG TPA: tRNA (adenosine(37)-N6)-threonylcarbamoyltransferase complex ATPase subunit type 1 TsaE [Bacteroidetes bacterium]|nr:tRNA (adenosine(37)-N6)-threonylcarbamoyltransferase complex ATPase subunit type 1 TsaE [Bacteroidota bacterium]
MTINNIKEIGFAASQILNFSKTAKTFALSGDLGAGKTTLVQAICRHLGITENVTSPTFSLVNEYPFQDKNGEAKLLRHLDLYRLKTIEEALGIGIEDYLYDGNYCFIEWPELIEALLPTDTVNINISILNDSSRKILIL